MVIGSGNEKMKISELKEGQKIEMMKLKVLTVYPIRNVNVKNNLVSVQDLLVTDDETETILTLWKDNCGKVQEGCIKTFTSILVRKDNYTGELTLSTGFFGRILD